jgi:hypothetical protein
MRALASAGHLDNERSEAVNLLTSEQEKIMSGGNEQIQVVLDEGSEVGVVRGGVTIKVHFNANGGVEVYSNVPVTLHQAANDVAGKTAPQIGDLDDDGVYVGLSAENGKPLHAALKDLPDYKTYEEALAAADQLKSLHPTAHVPTPRELDTNLFDNRNTGHLKGTFNTSGSPPGSVYRSSASYNYVTARVQWFDDGLQGNYGNRRTRLPVRLVW